MASKNMKEELGKAVIEHEKKLAADKLKDMRSVFANLAKLNDTASKLNEELSNFTKKYGMNKQSVEDLFGLSSAHTTLIRSTGKNAVGHTENDAAENVNRSSSGEGSVQY